MHALLEIENSASEAELEQAYKGKRQRYLKEIKTTSAKPRIRLLKDKLSKLETAYEEYLNQAGEPALTEEEQKSFPVETKTVEESREQRTVTPPSSLDSLPNTAIYPVLAVEGKLMDKQIKDQLSFSVDGKTAKLNDDGSLSLAGGTSTVRIDHPDFETWEQSCETRNAIAMPLTINLKPLKTRFALDVCPPVSFRLFLNGAEHPRSMDDRYEIPVHQTRLVTVKANGYEDFRFSVDNSQKEDQISVTLNPLPQYCDLVTAKTPFKARNTETGREIKITSGECMLFGRAANCMVRLCQTDATGCSHDELFISREHFSIRKEEQKVFLADHSSNGTYLNGKKIKGEQELSAGIFHEIGIFNPHEKKFVLRKSLLIHVDTPAPGSKEPSSPLFLTMGNLSSDTNSITHLLLFSEFSRMRENREERVAWLRRILPVLSDQSKSSSLSCLGEEVKLWQAEHQNA